MTKSPIDFSIGYQNIEGIHDKNFACKLPYIEKKCIHDIEIITETWGFCTHSKDIAGYKLVDEIKPQKKRKIVKGRSSGGLLVYVKSYLYNFIKKVLFTPQYMWLEVDKSIFLSLNESIHLCIAYNPPENSHYCNKDIYDEISIYMLKNCTLNSPILLIGDLNSRTGVLPDFQEGKSKNLDLKSNLSDHIPGRGITPEKRSNCDTKTNGMGIKLLDLCKAHDLQILNGRVMGDRKGSFTFHDTQQGASTIDVGIVSDSLFHQLASFVVLPQSDTSKHCKIVTRIKNMKADISKAETKEYPWIPTTKNYKWKTDSEDKLSKALSSILVIDDIAECNQYLDAGLVEPAAKKLAEIYTKAADATLEQKPEKLFGSNHPFKHKQKPKKWYDRECRHLKTISRKLAIQKQQDPTNTDLRLRHTKALKEYKALCSKRKAHFEQSQIQKLDEMLSKDPIEFWKEWKSFGDSYPANNLSNADGLRWERYFSNLFDNADHSPPPPIISPNGRPISINTSRLNSPFTLKELTDAIKKLKNKKAAGLDKLTSEFLKASPVRVQRLLLRLLNGILASGIVPKEWCLGVINPIHKEGCKEDPDNYRGICISSALTKLLSTMMNTRLITFLEENKALDKAQIGFTNDNRTSDHLLTLKSIVNKYTVDGNEKVYFCFIDFRHGMA